MTLSKWPRAGMILAVLLLAAVLAAQRQSIEEWEKQTFDRQPPEKVMDAVGINPGMAIGDFLPWDLIFVLKIRDREGS